ncbi:MAG: nuclear transport factor 2 family protein [Rhodanobacter sp.]|nr:MAG: nuclear transport factor 2 family protein [Rhodanobacter sp.]TAN28545.1 MAG: nuclear transport factor 2 family protein [Rhodanobacter sp.]
MSKLTRQQLVDLAVDKYFGNVDKKNMDAVLACMNEDTVVTIQTDHLDHKGIKGVRKMFETLFSTYKKTRHYGFEVTADAENQTVATRFNVTLEKPDGTFDPPMKNCNFFYVENGKFRRYVVFMDGTSVLP